LSEGSTKDLQAGSSNVETQDVVGGSFFHRGRGSLAILACVVFLAIVVGQTSSFETAQRTMLMYQPEIADCESQLQKMRYDSMAAASENIFS
jgi:hypothetical protein